YTTIFRSLLAITGKIELVYEGEQEGPAKVAHILIGKAIKSLLPDYLPEPEKSRKSKRRNPYSEIIDCFGQGHTLSLLQDLSDKEYARQLRSVPGLRELVREAMPKADEQMHLLLLELALQPLSVPSMLCHSYS